MKKTIAFVVEGERIEVAVERKGNILSVHRGDEEYTVELIPDQPEVPSVSSESTAAARGPAKPQRSAAAAAAPGDSGAPGGKPGGTIVASGSSGSVPAPMTGTIKEVLVHVGDTVQENEQVIMMEAMKMDIEVMAPHAGKVAEVYVQPGDSVRENQAVLRIE